MGENYCFNLSGMPCLVSARWQEDMQGGAMTKGAIGSASTAVPLPVVAKQRLQVPGVAFNPSVCAFEGELYVSARVMGGAEMPQAFLGRWAGDRIADGVFLRILEPLASGLLACGGQDIRIFVLDGVMHAVAAVGLGAPGPHTPIRQAIIRIEAGVIAQAWLQPGDSLEKNWMPCVDGDVLRLVYSASPLIVLDYDYEAGRVRQDVNAASAVSSGSVQRGGSQLVSYQDGWLAVVHQLHFLGGKKTYAHSFAFFDRALTSCRFGRPFYFNRGDGIEFCAGLAYFQDRWIVSYGVSDSEAWLAEIEPETVEAFLSDAPMPVALPAAPSAPSEPSRSLGSYLNGLGFWG
jgi:predicted GH43/DUF377 family glycosyl hydrolase